MFDHEHNHHHHDHDHEHHDHIDAFTLMDEEGNEHHFVLLGEVENKGKTYWVCEEIFVENDEVSEFGDTYFSSRQKMKTVTSSSTQLRVKKNSTR